MVFLKEFFKKVDFEKISRRHKTMQNYPGYRVNVIVSLKDIFIVAADRVLLKKNTNIKKKSEMLLIYNFQYQQLTFSIVHLNSHLMKSWLIYSDCVVAVCVLCLFLVVP